jgi:hypothetical protein
VKDWLTSVLDRIRDGTMLPPAYYRSLDCDVALDARERAGEFDHAWVSACDEVDRRWEVTAVDADLRALAEEIRKESFSTISRITRQHEIASYVSDDLDLIVRARLVGIENSLVDLLWTDYERGEFPAPGL